MAGGKSKCNLNILNIGRCHRYNPYDIFPIKRNGYIFNTLFKLEFELKTQCNIKKDINKLIKGNTNPLSKNNPQKSSLNNPKTINTINENQDRN